MVVIFCITHIDAPTRMGRMGVGSGRARSIQRKLLCRGTAWLTWGNQEYSLVERLATASGLEGRVFRMDRYRPIHMGSWMTMGPRQPRGLMPCSL